MSKDREYDDDGFPIYRPSAEEMAETRARMNTLVNCRNLAKEMLETRPVPDRSVLEELAQGHGIDGTKTITEIENEDLGDTYDVADEPIVHALRYVPVGRWTPYDIRLMLAYGHGVEVGLVLAERLLRDDPMLEAEFHAGDLLEIFVRLARETGKADLIRDLVGRVEVRIWEKFYDYARRAGLKECETEADRIRMQHGIRSEPGPNPFLNVEHDIETLAVLQDDADPPVILEEAAAKQLFAHYRPRKSVELVPLPDLENAEYRMKIGDPDTFKFRRDTVFSIAEDRTTDGVRLRIVAPSAINHVQGIWYEHIEAAKAAALRDYGIKAEDWHKPDAPAPFE